MNIFDKLNRIKYNFGIPYWITHSLVALFIQAVTTAGLYLFVDFTSALLAGTFSAMFFYIGREIRDREKEGYWDWPGLISPIISSTFIYLWLRLL